MTHPKKCFVITAIGNTGSIERELADTVLQFLIKPVCQELGYHVIRVDQETATGNINEAIINHLKNDDLVIADMTGHNANAFYELGYRQALNLPLIPIIRDGETLPFDVTAERTIFYNTDVSKIEVSKAQLKAMVATYSDFIMPSQKQQQAKSELDIINQKLNQLQTIEQKLDKLLQKPSYNSSLLDSSRFEEMLKSKSTLDLSSLETQFRQHIQKDT